jgi:hypothetical protein
MGGVNKQSGEKIREEAYFNDSGSGAVHLFGFSNSRGNEAY